MVRQQLIVFTPNRSMTETACHHHHHHMHMHSGETSLNVQGHPKEKGSSHNIPNPSFFIIRLPWLPFLRNTQHKIPKKSLMIPAQGRLMVSIHVRPFESPVGGGIVRILILLYRLLKYKCDKPLKLFQFQNQPLRQST